MTPPLMGGEEQGHSSVAVSSSPTDCLSQNGIGLKERNYLGFSDCSSVDSSGEIGESKSDLNFKATELRLGLPGSQSPEREISGEKNLFPLLPSMKSVVSGNKRGFSEVKASAAQPVVAAKEAAGKVAPAAKSVDMIFGVYSGKSTQVVVNCTGGAQVVGWPPIRSFRKNSLSMASKNNEEVDGKLNSGALFIKVSMDGAPYLRKVDLRSYVTYQELSSALEKMFSCFTIGQCGSHGAPSKEKLSESKLRDLLNGSEYVLTYEDKDGDWMLVGDVPWEMFIDSCKKLKIMKGSDAIGLAPKQK